MDNRVTVWLIILDGLDLAAAALSLPDFDVLYPIAELLIEADIKDSSPLYKDSFHMNHPFSYHWNKGRTNPFVFIQK